MSFLTPRDLALGGAGQEGTIRLRNALGDQPGAHDVIVLDGGLGDNILVRDPSDPSKRVLAFHSGGTGAELFLGAHSSDGSATPGVIHLRDNAGNDSIGLHGHTGDIVLQNADCAEEFDVAESEPIEPGALMVIDDEGKLRQSRQAYDRKVAGVISGAGDYRPGIILDRKPSILPRTALAVVGKVYSKVDAYYGSIEVEDLLTTSQREQKKEVK